MILRLDLLVGMIKGYNLLIIFFCLFMGNNGQSTQLESVEVLDDALTKAPIDSALKCRVYYREEIIIYWQENFTLAYLTDTPKDVVYENSSGMGSFNFFNVLGVQMFAEVTYESFYPKTITIHLTQTRKKGILTIENDYYELYQCHPLNSSLVPKNIRAQLYVDQFQTYLYN